MQVKFLVSGLTCNHCKQSVESNISKLPGVSNVQVDLATKTLSLDTNNVDTIEEQVKTVIDDLGYDYEGKLA